MSLAVCALGEAFKFLKYLMLDVSTIPILDIQEYSHESDKLDKGSEIHSAMILDAQALENLEVFEVQGNKSKTTEGSLFHYLNQCVTKFGK